MSVAGLLLKTQTQSRGTITKDDVSACGSASASHLLFFIPWALAGIGLTKTGIHLWAFHAAPCRSGVRIRIRIESYAHGPEPPPFSWATDGDCLEREREREMGCKM